DDNNSLKNIVDQLREVEKIKINLPKGVENKVFSIENLINRYNNDGEKFIQLSEMIESYENSETELSELSEKSNQAEEERKSLLGQLKKCPYCETELSEKARKTLIGE
ncbi:MAG: hypothetical protein ACTSUP_07840, partial [Candidatus Heimdallarchaeaceae archaeon]